MTLIFMDAVGQTSNPYRGTKSRRKTLVLLESIETVEAGSEYGEGTVTVTLRSGQRLAMHTTLAEFEQAVQAAQNPSQVAPLPAKYNLVCKMLKDANDVLRSCAQVANREGKSTDWPVFAQVLSQILREQHEYMVREKLLESAPDIHDLPAAF